jgi:endonuclease-3
MKRTIAKLTKGRALLVKGKAVVRVPRVPRIADPPVRPARKASRRIPKSALPAYALEVLSRLKREYPDAHTELNFETPLQLLVATILSAQCTDKRVNMVTPLLFQTYPTAAALADASPEKLEEIIKSTGFFRNKTKSLIGLGQALGERHKGEVPDSMDALVKLPGVGRKTANVVLGNAFGKNVGVVVDTHVARVSQRLGLTRETDPVKIEHDLMPLFPSEDWTLLAHLLIFHGRRVCEARRPKCEICVLNDICPSSTVTDNRERK